MGKKEKKSEGKLKLTKEQEEKVIKKGVVAMTKIIERLEEENEELKEWKENLIRADKKKSDHIDELEEENKKLNIKVASLEGEIKGLNYTIEKLREENQYRESIADVLPEGEGHIAEETIQDLQKENKNLKEGLEDVEKIIEYYKNDKKLMEKQIKKLKEELSKYKKQYQHSMGFSDFGGYDLDR